MITVVMEGRSVSLVNKPHMCKFFKNVPVTLLSSCGEFLTVLLTAIEHPSSVKEPYDNTESDSPLM